MYVCMYLYIYTSIYLCINISICLYVYISVYLYIRISIYTTIHMYVRIYMYVYICMYIYIMYEYVHICTCTRIPRGRESITHTAHFELHFIHTGYAFVCVFYLGFRAVVLSGRGGRLSLASFTPGESLLSFTCTYEYTHIHTYTYIYM